jgi:uncharacterized protein (TIGR03435 family)
MAGRLWVAGLLVCGVMVGQAQDAASTPAAGSSNVAAASNALTFDVASVRPSADFNSAAMQSAMQAGKMPKFGMNIEGLRAEYNQMQLRDLVANAYEVKPYQVSGPDYLNGQRFDIAARMPEGSTAADAPKMLRALLEDRFKLEVKTTTEDRSVLALVVGKSGLKMKQVPAPPPLDDTAELAPGQMKIDTGEGPAIMTMRQGSGGNGFGGATMNMGSKGVMTYSPKMDGQSFTLHMDFSGVTLPALAAMLTQMTSQGPMGGGAKATPVVDMTGLAGNYDTSLDFSPQMNMGGGPGGPGGPRGGGGGDASGASDPGGSGAAGIYESVQKMGLKLESRKAPVEQVVVTHVEKTPTDN